jgi:DNA-binding NarL/FixJ family response regulator
MAATLFPDPMKIPHKRLSNRELQIFLLLASGKSINGIADELALSANTVSTHKHRLMLKLGAENNASLVRYAVMHELVS